MNNSSVWFKRAYAIIFAAVLLAAAVGCTVGPKYKRPDYPTPPAFRGADDAAVISDAQGSLGDEQWAQVFREPELQDLIRKALTNNYDLRIAAQRILEQQAQVQITRSQQFPTLSVGGTGLGVDAPALSNITGGSNSISSPIVAGSFSLSAAWNPDFWGLYRRQTEAARATLLAQTWAQRAVRLTLVQEVATTYIQLRALDLPGGDHQADIEGQAGLSRPDEAAGEWRAPFPLSDLRQAEQLLYTATSELPQLEQQVQQQENALRLLLGENPGPVAHTDPNALTPPPQDLPTGIPSQLLERRPDIQQIGGTAQSGQREHWRGACAILSPAIDQCFGRCWGKRLVQLFDSNSRTIYGLGSLDPAAL